MLDPVLRPIIDPPLLRAGRVMARLGVTPNGVTVFGFIIGMAAVPALAFENYWLALCLILGNRLADGLDGAVARSRPEGGSDYGGYLDIVLDFIFYAAVPFGFLLGDPARAVPAAFLMVSFAGTGSSFLTYAILAAKRGTTTELRGRKAFYYLGGLTEGTETIAAFALMCVFPGAFAWIAWIFGAACWLTTGTRIWAARAAFSD